jgi:hypothetical protein
LIGIFALMPRKRTLPSRNLAAYPWRQVRIFIKDNRKGEGYVNLLGYLAQPLQRSLSATPFYFSRYGPMVKGVDDADTKIEEMPADFWLDIDGKKQHLSMRLRFLARKNAEDFIVQKLNAAKNLYWYSEILEYKTDGFAEPRVFVGADPGPKLVRAGLVADLFCANARFILDTLVNNGGQWAFQTNPNGGTFPTNFRFALHMMNNAYGLPSGELCPVGFPIQVAQPTCGFEQV